MKRANSFVLFLTLRILININKCYEYCNDRPYELIVHSVIVFRFTVVKRMFGNGGTYV